MTIACAEGVFTSDGSSMRVSLYGKYNLLITGSFAATIAIERSFDGGASFIELQRFTSPTQLVGEEPESNIIYRLTCSTFASGAASYRLSR
jgi:hypothetical protein